MTVASPVPCPAASRRALLQLLARSSGALVLTGAGCSTESGIPDYRDAAGGWKHRRPMTYQRFVGDAAARRRYWAGSMVGWRRIAAARPNGAHHALATLARAGRLLGVVTQNVDGLHGAAGSREVVELHGTLHKVVCLACRFRFSRRGFQDELLARNPAFEGVVAGIAPDGDARVPEELAARLAVPDCPRCGGLLKPDVVFFGEAVPRERVARAQRLLAAADALVVVGSSLMVWSGYRFALWAAERGLPIAAVNLGVTRADSLLTCKVAAPAGAALPELVADLGLAS